MANPLRELLRLPVVVWLYGLDGAQRLVQGDWRSDDPDGDDETSLPAPGPRAAAAFETAAFETAAFETAAFEAAAPDPPLSSPSPTPRASHPGAAPAADAPFQEKAMDDKNLSDDMVKLVTYDIVSIAREAERILCSGSVMVTDNTSGEAFASWMIARHLQADGGPDVADSERKYLRVHYRVKERWPKQSLYYEERQLATLEGIQDAIRQATLGREAEAAPTSTSKASSSGRAKPKTGS